MSETALGIIGIIFCITSVINAILQLRIIHYKKKNNKLEIENARLDGALSERAKMIMEMTNDETKLSN